MENSETTVFVVLRTLAAKPTAYISLALPFTPPVPGMSPFGRVSAHYVVRPTTILDGFRTALAVSSFRFRARLGFSIPVPPCGTQQISQGKTFRLCGHHVAITSGVPTDTGLRRWGPAYPLLVPYGASFAFATATHLWLPPDAPLRARYRLRVLPKTRSSGSAPLPLRCRVPSVRASG